MLDFRFGTLKQCLICFTCPCGMWECQNYIVQMTMPLPGGVYVIKRRVEYRVLPDIRKMKDLKEKNVGLVLQKSYLGEECRISVFHKDIT